MRAERLFSILGLLDPILIEEAVSASSPAADQRRPRALGRFAAIAACCALVLGAVFWMAARLGPISAESTATADTADGTSEGAADAGAGNFLSYAGPVLPLTTLEGSTALTAERTLTFDFVPGTYADGSPRQWGAQVTDRYTLTNPTDADITVTALYPVAGSLADLASAAPAVTVDGAGADYTVYAGGYAGTFGDENDHDGSTWNLAGPYDWEDYAALLEDEGYRSAALGSGPDLDIPVTVYRFSDFSAPLADYSAATQAVTFTIDPAATAVLSYGFNGMSSDTESGWRQYSYFVPDGVRGESEVKLLAVLGEDIGDYSLQGYSNGGCQVEIDGVRCAVTRQETTLAALLAELCRLELAERSGMDQWAGLADQVSLDLYVKAAAEQLTEYGLLADAPMDRYADGRLDELLSEALTVERVLYLAVPVTAAAGGSAEVSVSLWKNPSYDFACSGTGREDLQGYDLLTTAGSSLSFTGQTVRLVNTENVEITAEDLGLDGGTEAALDPTQPHYYLELRPLED